MGRAPRIEFEGAVYHVMCRGNRQEPVFRDSRDNELFLDALAEACGRTGWRVHAFVLMGNHYHLLIETPEANLVDGMRWIQSTYTKRFNIRHKQWGHLFQSRYKALVVDPAGDYFQTVSSYIHLNPARAKQFDVLNGTLTDYVWSSYPAYLLSSSRTDWLAVDRVLGSWGLSDDRAGRERYRQLMRKRVLEIAVSENPHAVDERWVKIRQGWCFGGDEFRDRMVKALDGVMEGKQRNSFVGDESRRHDMLEADRLVAYGLEKMKMSEADLDVLKKNDPRKKVIAWFIRKRTSVRNVWISERLKMGSQSKLSSYIKEVEGACEGELGVLKEMAKR
ncbi:MAG: REP-associated tyrosine transposase [Verrucomicrobiota bacterium]|jgi:REP element-mobilizing transposase RayT|nr:REP-associated tyrosine transposase [Verrucomicrobiota bacterium]